jgi:hypothetical protein
MIISVLKMYESGTGSWYETRDYQFHQHNSEEITNNCHTQNFLDGTYFGKTNNKFV